MCDGHEAAIRTPPGRSGIHGRRCHAPYQAIYSACNASQLENEEDYFALVERFVDGSAWPQDTAVFDPLRQRMLTLSTPPSDEAAVMRRTVGLEQQREREDAALPGDRDGAPGASNKKRAAQPCLIAAAPGAPAALLFRLAAAV
jgi:hypothetical protein